jgi:hypothetical protein
MSKRIDLPCGGWADIKDPDQLTNRDRKSIRRLAIPAMSLAADLQGRLGGESVAKIAANPTELSPEMTEMLGSMLSADEMDRMDDVQAAVIVAYVAKWSLGSNATTMYGEDAVAPWAVRLGGDGTFASPNPTAANVDDLPGPVYDAFAHATADLTDGSVDTSAETVLDPSGPTMPSAV